MKRYLGKQRMQPQKNKVLIVDDNPTILTFLRAFLSKDYEVAEATNGVEALEILARQKQKVVIMDIMMPVMNGLQALVLIRASSDFAGTKVALMSALDQAQDASLEGTVVHQADKYFAKPMKIEEIRQWVAEQF